MCFKAESIRDWSLRSNRDSHGLWQSLPRSQGQWTVAIPSETKIAILTGVVHAQSLHNRSDQQPNQMNLNAIQESKEDVKDEDASMYSTASAV